MYRDYITILCSTTGEVYYKELTKEDSDLLEIHIEEFFDQYDLNINECSYMITPEPPSFIKLKNVKHD